MTVLIDICVCLLARGVFFILGVLPQGVRVGLCAGLFRIAFALIPRCRQTVLTNLAIAFPDRSEAWRRQIMKANAWEMGRLLADTIRIPSLGRQWIESHVEIPILQRYIEAHGKTGVLVATGHLGSFELLGHAIGSMGYPLSAVARKFKSPRLDAWWTGLREAGGNTIIDRQGAFRKICSTIKAGSSVAVLIDQNVRVQHAVFVDWFNKPAATTRAFALAALKTQAPVFVAAMKYCGNDRYRVDAVECNFSALYNDPAVDDDHKVRAITDTISRHYCDMIRDFPEGWFWLHRRWKTRPEGDVEQVY